MATTQANTDQVQWISGREAARLLGCDNKTLVRIARAAGASIRRRQLPGQHVRYAREDVVRVGQESLLDNDQGQT